MRQDFDAWCKWHKKRNCFRSLISYLKGPENRLIMHMRLYEQGGGDKQGCRKIVKNRNKASEPLFMGTP